MDAKNLLGRLSVAASATSFGDALYSFAVPLLIFQITKSPLLAGLEVAAGALGNLLGSYIVRRYMLATSDRAATIAIDAILAVSVFAPALAHGNLLVALLFVTSFANAVLQTAKSGYYESFVGHLAEGDVSVRQQIVGTIKTFANAGSLAGYAAAAPLVLLWPLGGVLGITAAMYLLSAVTMSTLGASVVGAKRATGKPAMEVLFSKRLRWLSIAHGTAAVALYFVNASVVFTLAGHFAATAAFISAYFVCQFAGAMLGSAVLSVMAKRMRIGVRWGPYLRVAYAIPFLVIAAIDDRYVFLGAVSFLAIVHAFSLPIWQSYFQSSAPSDHWRVVGASRKALVSIVGAGSAATAGWLLTSVSYQTVFLIGALAALLSAGALVLYADSETRAEEGKDAQADSAQA